MSIGICILFSVLFLSTLESGCIDLQNTNLTYSYPYNIETLIGKQDVLEIEVLPLEADARNVVFSLYAPPEISFSDPQSKEFDILAKDQKVIVPFNYSALTDGTFNITFEVRIPDNSTRYNIIVNASVPSPDLEIGEFWVYNLTKGNAKGHQIAEVVRKDTIEGNKYYVIENTWDGDLNGTHSLSYYSTDSFSQKMTEYYEDGVLLKEKTVEVDPPGSIFPFRVGMKGSWSGSITGVGKVESNSEIVKKEKIAVPAGTYTGYFIRNKMTLSMATAVKEDWYVPELNGFAKMRNSINALGITNEDESELIEHGKLPAKPPKIQLKLEIPDGYKLYKNDEFNFRLAYPKNWDFSPESGIGYSSFYFKDGLTYTFVVTVSSIGKLNLEEYKKQSLDSFKRALPGTTISEQKNVTINGREGFQWVYEHSPTGEKGKVVIFVSDGNGYIISSYSLDTVYNSYKPMFENILNSFFIRGDQNKYVLS